MEMADYFRMLNSRLDEQEKRSDNRYEALQEDLRNTNQRLEELQLRVPRPRLADVGIQKGKSGELEEITTEAGEKIITPPKPQRQQPLLPSQPPRLPPQPPMATADDATDIDVSTTSAAIAASTSAILPIAASSASAPTLITVFGWSTAISLHTFHDRNVKSPIARRCWS